MAPRNTPSSPVNKFIQDLRSGKIKVDEETDDTIKSNLSIDPKTGRPTTPTTTTTTTIPKPVGATTPAVSPLAESKTNALFSSPAFQAFQNNRIDAQRAGLDAAKAGRIATGQEKDWGQRSMDTVGKAFQAIIELDVIPDEIPFTRYLPGRGDTNIGLPGPKEFRPIKMVADPLLYNLGIPGSAILSTLKEIRDIGDANQTFSAREWLRQTLAKPTIKTPDGKEFINPDYLTYGGLVGNIVDPDSLGGYGKWVNRTIGLLGTVFLDPVNLSTGPGGLAKTAVANTLKTGAKEALELTAEAAARRSALEALELGAKGRVLTAVERAELSKARSLYEVTADAAAEASAPFSRKQLRNAQIALDYQAAERNLALAKKSGNADTIATATKEFDRAFREVNRITPRATRGPGARAANAADVAGLYDEAQQILRYTPEELAEKGFGEADVILAQRFVDVITPEKILDIGTQGWSSIRGEVAEILGRRSNMRWGLPGGPKYAIFGRPGEAVFNAMGEMFTIARIGNPSSRVLSKIPILKQIADGGLLGGPLGRRFAAQTAEWSRAGLWDEATAKEVQIGLKTGKWSDPVLKQNAIDFLKWDARMRSLNGIEEANLNAAIAQAFKGKGGLQGYLQNKAVLRALNQLEEAYDFERGAWRVNATPELEIALNRVDYIDKIVHREVQAAYRALGFDGEIPRRRYYGVPRVMTKNATKLASTDPALFEKIIDAMRTVKPKTIQEANELAIAVAQQEGKVGRIRAALGPTKDIRTKPVNFKFYEENVYAAYQQYFKSQSRDIAYARLISELMDGADAPFKRIRQTIEVTPKTLTDYRFVVDNVFDEADVARFKPEDIEILSSRLEEVKKVLGGEYSTSKILTEELDTAMSRVQEALEAAKANAYPPEALPLVTNETENLITALARNNEQIMRLWDAALQRPDRWKTVVAMVDEGMVALSDSRLLSDVAVRADVAEMWRNARKLADPEFALGAEKFLQNSLNLWKANKTASVGFFVRNLLGDTVSMIVHGANPKKLIESTYVLKRWNAWLRSNPAVAQRIAVLATPFVEDAPSLNFLRAQQLDEFIKTLPKKYQSPARGAIEGIGFVGMGQMAEAIGGAPLKTVGVFGVPTVNPVSRALGAPLRLFGKPAEVMQNYTRFAYLYDGIASGLSPASAGARVNKALINYQDLSNLDERAKKVVPFWMFFSNNLPMQIENLWMNPQAYAVYDRARQGLEDPKQVKFDQMLREYYSYDDIYREALAEGDTKKSNQALANRTKAEEAIDNYLNVEMQNGWRPKFIPQWVMESGGWRVRGTDQIFRSPFGAFGAGELPLEQQLNPFNQLTRLRPELRVPLEILSGQKALTGEELYPADKYANPELEIAGYAFRESPIGSPFVQYGRYASALGGAGVPGVSAPVTKAVANDYANFLLGTRPPKDNEEEYLDALNQSFESFIGSPFFRLLEPQERSELWRRSFQFKQELERQRAKKATIGGE